MQTLFQNLRFSMRMLRKSTGVTITVALTLALGIGATTAIYTVVYATLLAPMPYPEPDQLVMVWSNIGGHNNSIAAADFLDWKRLDSSFQDINAFTGESFNMAGKDAPEMVEGQKTTPGMYRMLGSPFQFGRDFLPEEGVDGKDHVVILMNKMWRRLGADPKIIGRQITLNQRPYTVVGVLAPGQSDRLDQQLIVPLAFKPDQINHDYHWLLAMGRLKPGVSIQQAQSNMALVTAAIAKDNPRSNQGWGASVEPLKNDFLPSERIQTLWLLLVAVGLVLLIACVNVANLLLARGATRHREIAVRTSLGATRGRIFVQFLTESVVLAGIGGVLGVAVGFGLLRAFIAIMPQGTLPSEADLSLNLPVLAVALGSTLFAGLLFGSAPAWFATRVDPGEALKEGGRAGTGAGRQRLRRLLVISEFALALAILSGAGLAIHSFWNLTRVDLGVRTDHVLTFDLNHPQDRFKTASEIESYYRQILASLQAVPSVDSATAVTGMPLRGPNDGMPFTLVGGPSYADPSKRPGAGFQSITPDYFKTFGIRVLRGRAFSDQDSAGGIRVAMVNEEFVRRYLGGMDPLRQRISVEQLIPGVQNLGPAVEWQIVGVFHNVRAGGFRSDFPEIDVPFAQSLQPDVTIGVRTGQDPAAIARSIAAAIHGIDAQVALAHVRTLEDIRNESLAGDRFVMLLYGCFAGIALLLAGVGIYGVMAFTVAQREHEIGLRMALGASRRNVVLLIVREAMTLSFVGLLLGLVGAYFVGRAMQSTLFAVAALDFTAISMVSVVLFAAALLASWIPALRGATVEPVRALRTE